MNADPSSNVKVLVVDDEEAVRRMVSRLVERLGYEALTAADGGPALELAKKVRPDVVVTDLRMGAVGGLELAKRLLAWDPDLPVILMTAYADVESAREALSVGLYEYFAKPFEISDVAASIKRAVERRRLRLENLAYQRHLEEMVRERTAELQEKVRQLEARDTLLKSLLSIESDNDPISDALTIALDLVEADAGVFYLVDGRTVTPRVAVGFGGRGCTLTGKELEGAGFLDDAMLQRTLDGLLRRPDLAGRGEVHGVREGYGMGTFGAVAIVKDGEVIGLVEVDRSNEAHPVEQADLRGLREFVPYLAMAVLDLRVNDVTSDLCENVDELLQVTDAWKV